MPKPTFTWADIDALRETYAVTEDHPGSFTIAEYAERYNLPYQTAAGQLTGIARKGKLETGMTSRNGKRVRVYWVAS